MDPTKTEIRSILNFLSYYDPYLPNTIQIRRALNRFLVLLDNCPPHPISEELREETLQIFRILGGREQTLIDRINRLNQEFQNESNQNP